MLGSLADALLGLLFPDRCVGCGRAGALLCRSCQSTIRLYPPAQLNTPRMRTSLPHVDDIAVAFVFEGALREAIHALKYTRLRRTAPLLGALLSTYTQRHSFPGDALIPVPLHHRRLAERGFNQSTLLANHLGRTHQMPVIEYLVRQQDTEHQVQLDVQARRANVEGAFVWAGNTPPPRRVIIVDDVLTTGATIDACAVALRNAGADEVRAVALARSLPRPASSYSVHSSHSPPFSSRAPRGS